MATDLPDYTKATLSVEWWKYNEISNFVERWEQGLFDRRKFHGRTGAYYISDARFPPPYWDTPQILTARNTMQPAPFNNVVIMRNTSRFYGIDSLYFAANGCFRIPVILNFDAYFAALNLANYPNGTQLYAGLEINSGGYMGDIMTWIIYTAGGVINSLLHVVSIEDGVPTVRTTPVVGLVTGAWRGFKLQLTENDLTLYMSGAASGFPMTELARLPYSWDYAAHVIPFFANESTAAVNAMWLGQFQCYTATRLKEVRHIIDYDSIVAGGLRASACQVFPKSAVFQIRQTYGAAAAAGVQVWILGASDQGCTIIDSMLAADAFDNWTPSFLAGATRHSSHLVENLPKYGTVVVANLDGANAQGAVDVWMHKIPYDR